MAVCGCSVWSLLEIPAVCGCSVRLPSGPSSGTMATYFEPDMALRSWMDHFLDEGPRYFPDESPSLHRKSWPYFYAVPLHPLLSHASAVVATRCVAFMAELLTRV